MELTDYFKNGKVYVWKETFALIKSKRTISKAFANILDKDGITTIIDQSKHNKKDVIAIKKDFKIITFDIDLPFGTIGFLSKILKKLADAKISILAISSYHKDHILVKKKDLSKALNQLEKLGLIFEKK